MAERLASYVPDEVVIIITHDASGTSHRVVGYMQDSFVTIARAEDSWTHETSADGKATRINNANDSGTIVIDIMQSSASNDYLTALYNYDKQYKNNKGVFSIIVKDGSGRSMDRSDEAYISTYPERVYGNGINGRTWTISCTQMESYVGGNSLLDIDTQDALNSLNAPVDDSWKQ